MNSDGQPSAVIDEQPVAPLQPRELTPLCKSHSALEPSSSSSTFVKHSVLNPSWPQVAMSMRIATWRPPNQGLQDKDGKVPVVQPKEACEVDEIIVKLGYPRSIVKLAFGTGVTTRQALLVELRKEVHRIRTSLGLEPWEGDSSTESSVGDFAAVAGLRYGIEMIDALARSGRGATFNDTPPKRSIDSDHDRQIQACAGAHSGPAKNIDVSDQVMLYSLPTVPAVGQELQVQLMQKGVDISLVSNKADNNPHPRD